MPVSSSARWAGESVESIALAISTPSRATLRASASVAVTAFLLASGTAALAQQAPATGADEPTPEDIVVTGFRQSLENAQAIKRNANTIVDSVTAEDIGALPDRSVTETLQRIPGISINRFAAGIDPDHFSVEGSGVVVRGLTYVRSEFNGREAFSAGNGRGLGFQDVPSELLGGVDVYKSPSADRIEGGIAGTVNLRTRLPFDQKDFMLAGSVENNYGDFIQKSAPTLSAIASKRWETGIGEIGILGSISYSKLLSRADRFQVSSFRPRPLYTNGARNDVVPFEGATQQGEVIFPRGAVMGTQEFDRERYGYSAALQWRSTDGSVEATFQFLRSDARQAWTEHAVEIATDNVSGNGDSRAVAGTSFDYDETGLFEEGFITGPTGWRADRQGADGTLRTPVIGLQSNNVRRDRDERLVTSDYSANLRWQATERFALSLDYQHVASTAKLMDNGMWASTYQDAYIKLNGGGLPEVRFLPPQNCTMPVNGQCQGVPGTHGGTDSFNDDDDYPAYFTGQNQSFLAPANSFFRSAMDHAEDSDGNSDAVRIDGDFMFADGSFLKSIRAGLRYADRSQTARFSAYNWGVITEQWGNGGPVWMDEPVDGVSGGTGGSPLNIYQPFVFSGFMRNAIPNPLGGDGRLFYAFNTVKEYETYLEHAGVINREWRPQIPGTDGVLRNDGFNGLAQRPGAIPGTYFTPGEVNSSTEKNKAAYVMLNFDNEFSGGVRLTGNVGLRYTRTERVSRGFLSIANNPSIIPSEQTCADVVPPNDPPPFCTFTPAERQQARNFMQGSLIENDVTTTYDYWLPSFNARLEVGNGVQFRLAYFKGVSPPDFGLVRNFYNIQGLQAVPNVDGTGSAIPNSFTIQATFDAGNPRLKPIEADNFDLTAEWYFSRVGQLTFALFHKRLTNVLTNDIVRSEVSNNGATFPAVIRTPVNSTETGKITGFEIAYQQTYDFLPGFLRGFGLQANYTFVDSTGVPQTTLSATDPDVAAGRQPNIAGENFPLQGLSRHQFNITPFFDYGPLSVRLSYNWRSEYLLTIRDVIVPYDPIFQQAYGQLDGSVTFSVNDKLKLGVQMVNLTNAITKTSAAILDQNEEIRKIPRGWYLSDRRFTFIARFNF